MIQRIQTVYLFLAGGLLAGVLFAPVFTADAFSHSGQDVLPVGFPSAVAGLLSLIAIFLFKNQPLQRKLCLAAILAAMLALCIGVWSYLKHVNETIAPGLGFFFIPVGVILISLAIRNIRKDENLLRSYDRLR